MPSPLYLAVGISRVIIRRDPLLFDSTSVVRAADWLGRHRGWEAPVLSALRAGRHIAGPVGHRLILGRLMETANLAQTSQQIERFYAVMKDAERRRLLAEAGAQYVFFGLNERALGGFDLAGADNLVERYRSGDAAAYVVVEP